MVMPRLEGEGESLLTFDSVRVMIVRNEGESEDGESADREEEDHDRPGVTRGFVVQDMPPLAPKICRPTRRQLGLSLGLGKIWGRDFGGKRRPNLTPRLNRI